MFANKYFRLSILALLSVGVIVLGYSFVKRIFFSPPIDARVQADNMKVGKEEVIQVNVMNATVMQGAAKKTMEYLRRRGFDVVEVDNYGNIEARSLVIDRVGDSLSAHKVAYAMGIAEKFIRTNIDSSLYLHCSVVIGNDYEQLKPFQ